MLPEGQGVEEVSHLFLDPKRRRVIAVLPKEREGRSFGKQQYWKASEEAEGGSGRRRL